MLLGESWVLSHIEIKYTPVIFKSFIEFRNGLCIQIIGPQIELSNVDIILYCSKNLMNRLDCQLVM